jgi:hypothetical protein
MGSTVSGCTQCRIEFNEWSYKSSSMGMWYSRLVTLPRPLSFEAWLSLSGYRDDRRDAPASRIPAMALAALRCERPEVVRPRKDMLSSQGRTAPWVLSASARRKHSAGSLRASAAAVSCRSSTMDVL